MNFSRSPGRLVVLFKFAYAKSRHAAGGGLRWNDPSLQLKVVLTINEARQGIF
jgi:hypothetical protein